MRVLIVDDEAAARRRLSIMLGELDVEVVGEAENGVEALRMVEERHPDLLLLDISMPEVDGFDVARHLEDPKPLIVFQTAYDEHALEAFEHEAVDYLVKPVNLGKLERALQRARERLGDQAPELSTALLRQLRSVVAPSLAATSPRILVRERGGHHLVPYRDIVMFAADEGLVYALTDGGEHLTDYTLKELEDRTQGSFVRINRSQLVNLERIARIESNGDGSATITLGDGTDLRVARRRAADVRRTLQG
jgi:two-component system LytT family response regulator